MLNWRLTGSRGYRNFTTKLWNAARYAEMNECRVVPGFNPNTVQHTLNKWIIGEMAASVRAVGTALETYKFSDATQAVYAFVWGTFCDWYLEFTKPLLTGENVDAAVRAEVRATTAWALQQILHMLNPFMPFLTEELYGQTKGDGAKDLLLTAPWPDADAWPVDPRPSTRWIGWSP
jgi:valyl-tRNA synthetase